jgi:ATP-dependent Clp protease ATP-binding subunit ClpA
VIGQDQAVEAVVQAIQRSRARIKDPDRPIAVLLFMGPTGVGKTELAKATAGFLFGSDKAMARLDMSEFMTSHSVARLVGAPPGYVGYEKEGQLTGALRKKPFSVVLLDEIEKAHPDVLNLFLQVFEDGRLTDATGRTVDASNAIFIMTSNIIAGRDLGFRREGGAGSKTDLDEPLKAVFKPELINRIDAIVPFRLLGRDDLKKIARIMLGDLDARLRSQGLSLEVTEAAVDLLVNHGRDDQYGARPVRRMIEQAVENPLSAMIVRGDLRKGQAVVADSRDGQIELRVKAV